MNTIVHRMNIALSRNRDQNSYISPIANTYNGNSLLENYIAARLTNEKTIRLLLDQEQLQA